MSFTISKSVTPVKKYIELGGMEVQGDSETIEITVAIDAVVSITESNQCTVRYSFSTPVSSLSGSDFFEFAYSGTGSPIEEAESALKTQLDL